MTDQTSAIEAMRRALDAARLGPPADPNPRVGAVVVDRHGTVVGVGHHEGAGTPHAEVVALARAGERAAGGTVYVTLEPCAHTGRTPPCTEALAAAGVARVVYAVPDPSTLGGGGAERLSEQGVEVEHRPDPAAEELVAAWAFAVRHGRPRVVWKVAATLDGRAAAADRTSRWISSPEARADSHELRARCGAVVAGTGTILTDDPALTARHLDGTLRDRQPWRVAVGLRPVPPTASIRDGSGPTLVLATRDPHEVLAELHAREVRQVLLEGGPTLAAAFWRAGLVDEVVAYLAPALLGAGPAAVGDLGIATIGDLARLELTEVRRVGPDVRITARPVIPDIPSDAALVGVTAKEQ
jgi:diaminohydroxyphosphoribosylaminopyrimidine deaminase / 5-amino-6-(5-phosphoribosylamino)uracil reductase